jgi:hypothetical protein
MSAFALRYWPHRAGNVERREQIVEMAWRYRRYGVWHDILGMLVLGGLMFGFSVARFRRLLG